MVVEVKGKASVVDVQATQVVGHIWGEEESLEIEIGNLGDERLPINIRRRDDTALEIRARVRNGQGHTILTRFQSPALSDAIRQVARELENQVLTDRAPRSIALSLAMSAMTGDCTPRPRVMIVSRLGPSRRTWTGP